jgi:hypothetical protein
MLRRRSTRKLRPALERLDPKSLPGAGPWAAHLASLRAALPHHRGIAPSHPRRAAPPLRPITAPGVAPGCPGGLGRSIGPKLPPPTPPPTTLGTFTLVPDSGTLEPPFGQFLADSTRPVPGAVSNLTFLTIRNGTSQTFDSRSGFSVNIPGQGGSQPFLPKGSLWKPGGVIVVYSLSTNRFPGTFTFNFNGSIQEKPNNIFYNVQYNPVNFPATLDAIVARSVGARYRLV